MRVGADGVRGQPVLLHGKQEARHDQVRVALLEVAQKSLGYVSKRLLNLFRELPVVHVLVPQHPQQGAERPSVVLAELEQVFHEERVQPVPPLAIAPDSPLCERLELVVVGGELGPVDRLDPIRKVDQELQSLVRAPPHRVLEYLLAGGPVLCVL